MNILEKILRLEAQKDLLEELLKGDDIGHLGKIKVIDALRNVSMDLSELQEEGSDKIKEIEDSFVAGFDLETEDEEAHRKIEVRKQDDDTIRFTIISTFNDGVKVQNFLHLGKNAFYLFQNAFYKASRDFGFTVKDLREYEKSLTQCIEYQFEENENQKS